MKTLHMHEVLYFNNELVFQKNKVSINIEKTKNNNEHLVASIVHSINTYGYTLSKESYKILANSDENTITYFYKKVMKIFKNTKGYSSKYVFYKNFPDLGDMTKVDYIINAILHYYTSTSDSYGYMPKKENKREKLQDVIKLNEINIINEEEADDIVKEMITNFFEGSIAIMSYRHQHFVSYMRLLPNKIKPKEIPFKENFSLFVKGNTIENSFKYVNTITDLLRMYVALSNGDDSLINKTMFISLKRSDRRLFVSKLNELCNVNSYDELHSHEHLFKKMFEKLHVGEYAKQYHNAFEVVCNFRDSEYQTFNSKLQTAYKSGDIKTLSLLKSRPGVFARSIDSLLRNESFDSDVVLEAFDSVATKVSSKLLLELWEYYLNRNNDDTRIFSIRKQDGMILKEISDNRVDVKEEVIFKMTEILKNALSIVFSDFDEIDKVYLDESMKNFAIPKNARNASKGNKTLTFGSRVKLEKEKSVLRFFTHWKNSKYRIDIDLSMQLFDKNFNSVRTLAWHNMSGMKDIDCYHSGDIVSAPKGASEFIDLNLEKAKKIGRYAVICNNSFSCESFCDIPECFSGVMFREKSNSGEIFEPSTVEFKFNLTQDNTGTNIAFLIDLETLELVWMDRALIDCQSSMVSHGNPGLILLMKKALSKHISMYDLVKLHSNRLNFVDKEEAEFVISDDETSHLRQYDFEIWANWM